MFKSKRVDVARRRGEQDGRDKIKIYRAILGVHLQRQLTSENIRS